METQVQAYECSHICIYCIKAKISYTLVAQNFLHMCTEYIRGNLCLPLSSTVALHRAGNVLVTNAT